jgi:hypothetical protein
MVNFSWMNFLGDIKRGDNSWKNKYGYQLGVKYYNAFHIDNLLLQLEYMCVLMYILTVCLLQIMDIIIKVSDINGR